MDFGFKALAVEHKNEWLTSKWTTNNGLGHEHGNGKWEMDMDLESAINEI